MSSRSSHTVTPLSRSSFASSINRGTILVNIRDEHVGQLALPAFRAWRHMGLCIGALCGSSIHQMGDGLRNTLSKTGARQRGKPHEIASQNSFSIPTSQKVANPRVSSGAEIMNYAPKNSIDLKRLSWCINQVQTRTLKMEYHHLSEQAGHSREQAAASAEARAMPSAEVPAVKRRHPRSPCPRRSTA